jgi:hypothetical protein
VRHSRSSEKFSPQGESSKEGGTAGDTQRQTRTTETEDEPCLVFPSGRHRSRGGGDDLNSFDLSLSFALVSSHSFSCTHTPVIYFHRLNPLLPLCNHFPPLGPSVRVIRVKESSTTCCCSHFVRRLISLRQFALPTAAFSVCLRLWVSECAAVLPYSPLLRAGRAGVGRGPLPGHTHTRLHWHDRQTRHTHLAIRHASQHAAPVLRLW